MNPTVIKEIKAYLNETGIAGNKLSRMCGMSTATVNRILRGGNMCGQSAFDNLSKFISFSEEAKKEVDAVMANWQKGQVRSGYKIKKYKSRWHDPQPWPETVAKLKANPPMYARAW